MIDFNNRTDEMISLEFQNAVKAHFAGMEHVSEAATIALLAAPL
jgi:hypothetical protein